MAVATYAVRLAVPEGVRTAWPPLTRMRLHLYFSGERQGALKEDALIASEQIILSQSQWSARLIVGPTLDFEGSLPGDEVGSVLRMPQTLRQSVAHSRDLVQGRSGDSSFQNLQAVECNLK